MLLVRVKRRRNDVNAALHRCGREVAILCGAEAHQEGRQQAILSSEFLSHLAYQLDDIRRDSYERFPLQV